MSFSPETIIFLLQFDTGISYREMARQANIPLTQINSVRYVGKQELKLNYRSV